MRNNLGHVPTVRRRLQAAAIIALSILAGLFVLLALALALADNANANTYSTYVVNALNAHDNWELSANPNDSGPGANNGACTGTCTYGVAIGSYLTGYIPGTSTSYVGVSSQAFTASAGWAVALNFKTSSSSQQVLLYWTSGSTGIGLQVNQTSNCSAGKIDFEYANGGGTTVHCSSGNTYDDGNLHEIFVDASGGVCQLYVDGTFDSNFGCVFSTYPSTSYEFGNYTPSGPYPVLSGGVASVTSWNTSLPVNGVPAGKLASLLWNCASTNVCTNPTSPAPPCPTRPRTTLLWCEQVQFSSCSPDSTRPWWYGPIGPQVTAVSTSFTGAVSPGVATGSISNGSGGSGTIMTLGTPSAGTFLIGDVVSGTGVPSNDTIVSQSSGTPGGAGNYVVSAAANVSSITITSATATVSTTNSFNKNVFLYDTNSCAASANTNLSNSTKINGALVNTNFYPVIPSQTVASETMYSGYWGVGGYIHKWPELYSNTGNIAVAQNGGASGSINGTYRYLSTPLVNGQEDFLYFDGYFTDPGCSNCGWTTASFGFGSTIGSSADALAYVKFGSTNSPSAGYVNLELHVIGAGAVSNANVTAATWHQVILDAKRSTGSDGFVKLIVDGSTLLSYSGVTDTGEAPNDSVGFYGATVGGTPDAEANFTRIAVYAGPYLGPWYPPGGSDDDDGQIIE